MFHKYPYVPQVIPNSIVSYPTSFAPSSALNDYVDMPKANPTHNILFWKFPNEFFFGDGGIKEAHHQIVFWTLGTPTTN